MNDSVKSKRFIQSEDNLNESISNINTKIVSIKKKKTTKNSGAENKRAEFFFLIY